MSPCRSTAEAEVAGTIGEGVTGEPLESVGVRGSLTRRPEAPRADRAHDVVRRRAGVVEIGRAPTGDREWIRERLKQEIFNQALGVAKGDEIEVRRDPVVLGALRFLENAGRANGR